MKNRKEKIIIGTFLLVFCSIAVFAQTPPTFNGGDNNINDQAPISSLVALGLIAGAVYGIRKSRK